MERPTQAREANGNPTAGENSAILSWGTPLQLGVRSPIFVQQIRRYRGEVICSTVVEQHRITLLVFDSQSKIKDHK